MSFSNWLLRVQHVLEYLVAWPLVTLFRVLPESKSRALALGLSRLSYRVLGFQRRWSKRNLQLVFGPHLTPSQRTRLVMKSFENYVLTCVEVVRWTPEWMLTQVRVEGWDECVQVWRQAQGQGKGCIFLSAHFGNFELIPSWGFFHGFPGKVMYRPQSNPRFDRLLFGARGKYMPQLLPSGAFGLLKCKTALLHGEWVGLMIDHNFSRRGVFVEFLGFQASFAQGAAVLALATGCPVIFTMNIRQPGGRHHMVFHPPFPLIDTGDHTRDVAANTRQYMKAIEPYLLTYPEQYSWDHPIWRVRPEGPRWDLSLSCETMENERLSQPRWPLRELHEYDFRQQAA